MSLKVNERFFVRDREYRVVMVNSSRAHCVPVEPERVTIVDSRTRQPRTFTVVNHHALDISPNSPIELLSRPAESRS